MMERIETHVLPVIIQQFKHYKRRAEQAMEQLSDEEWHWKPNEASNSIAIIVQHMSGNMHSRWVDFLTSDGEKPYRDRDREFVDQNLAREELMRCWEKGWELLFHTVEHLKPEDLQRTVTVRHQPLSVLQAVLNELTHISYHVGQMLYLGKQIKGADWVMLSIPKNGSKAFNERMARRNFGKSINP